MRVQLLSKRTEKREREREREAFPRWEHSAMDLRNPDSSRARRPRASRALERVREDSWDNHCSVARQRQLDRPRFIILVGVGSAGETGVWARGYDRESSGKSRDTCSSRSNDRS